MLHKLSSTVFYCHLMLTAAKGNANFIQDQISDVRIASYTVNRRGYKVIF